MEEISAVALKEVQAERMQGAIPSSAQTEAEPAVGDGACEEGKAPEGVWEEPGGFKQPPSSAGGCCSWQQRGKRLQPASQPAKGVQLEAREAIPSYGSLLGGYLSAMQAKASMTCVGLD